MQTRRYALVAYLKNPAGEFVENLRRELHPDFPHLAAHLTILPPRPLQGSEDSALQVLERICGHEEPFHVNLGEVETFIPVTPTVFIRVEDGATRMRELHGKLNTEVLAISGGMALHSSCHHHQDECGAAGAQRSQMARQRWTNITVSAVSWWKSSPLFARTRSNCWVDLAPVLLGRDSRFPLNFR